jgi:type IV pilus assembly protein PilN
MAQINLLPWRERLREDRKRRFVSFIVCVIIGGGLSVLLADRYVRNEINNQVARNAFIESEIQILDMRVAEINELQEQKREIRERMNVIQNLQGSRAIIVRVFDELVKTLPEGVYFQSLDRVGDSLSIVGVAESYGQLTDLMRQLAASTWFKDPNLQIISATEGDEEGISADVANLFTLDLALVTPKSQDEIEFLQ